MTVEEHLIFYARLRGVKKIYENVQFTFRYKIKVFNSFEILLFRKIVFNSEEKPTTFLFGVSAS